MLVPLAPAVWERSVSEPAMDSHAPHVRPAPAIRRPSAGDNVAAMREEMRQKEHHQQQQLYHMQQQRHAHEMRNIYMVGEVIDFAVISPVMFSAWSDCVGVIVYVCCLVTGEPGSSPREQAARSSP